MLHTTDFSPGLSQLLKDLLRGCCRLVVYLLATQGEVSDKLAICYSEATGKLLQNAVEIRLYRS